jgi:hypothetical protein
MSEKELQQKFDRFFLKVEKMRYHQTQFFRYKSTQDLQAAKNLEREVDHMIRDEVRIRKSGQGEIFG